MFRNIYDIHPDELHSHGLGTYRITYQYGKKRVLTIMGNSSVVEPGQSEPSWQKQEPSPLVARATFSLTDEKSWEGLRPTLT